MININDLKPRDDNPREISGNDLEDLKNSLKEFKKGLEFNKIKVDEDLNILAGEQRYRALIELGYEEIPEEWVQVVDGLTDEEKERAMLIDNNHWGRWNKKKIKKFDSKILKSSKVPIKFIKENKIVEGEVEFSEYLGEANNYLVLLFDNDIDWLQARTHFGLKTVSSKRANGKEWSKGIGRVIDGAEYLKNIKDGF